ncbi:hypothetical protein BJ742DRAFT_673956, partial [Cladochytrium replicatum]
VDIGAPHTALLNFYAFEGATKRNSPALENGTVCSARVTVAPSKLGASRQIGVKQNILESRRMDLCPKRIGPKCQLLVALGERFAFESAVGFNGRVWVKSGSPRATVAFVNAIQHWESAVDKSRKVAKVWMNRLVPQA